MNKLIPLLCICFFLALLSEHNSIYDNYKERYVYKDRIFLWGLSLITMLFAGLRVAYNDTEAYINIYNDLSRNGLFTDISWKLGDHPGYTLVVNAMKNMGLSAYSYIFIFSIFTLGVEFWFIRKYTNNIVLSVVLFFTMGCFGFTMAAIKQCAAIAFCLIAVDRQIQKKYLSYILWLCVAVMFHPFAILFIITPFLEFRPWSAGTFVLFAGAGLLGFSMQSWLGRVVDLLSLMGKEYDESRLVGEGVNIFRLAVLLSPVALSLLVAKYMEKKQDNRIQNLMINLMMVNAMTMFIALFGNPIYFGRLANYFLIFQVIGITYLLQYFESRSRMLLMIIMGICYFAYCYYGNVFTVITFDESFRSISILEFLKNII